MKRTLFAIAGMAILAGFSLLVLRSEKAGNDKEELTLEQAAGQILLMGFEGNNLTPELEALMQKLRPGGILLLGRNIQGKEQLQTLIKDLQGISHIPLLVAVDQEGGIVSRVSWVESTPQAALQSSEHAFAIGELRGKGLHELGITMNLAPVLDSAASQDFLFERSFQKDEAESAEYARSLILGHMKSGVLSVPKHYPGYGGIAENPELQTIPRMSKFPDSDALESLLSLASVPFLMLSHVIYEDVDEEHPLPLSLAGMNKVRSRVGNEKIIVSDDLLSEAFLNAYDLKTLGTRAVYSGVDILLVAGYPDVSQVERFYDELLAAAQEDSVLAGRIEVAAVKILEAKVALFGSDGVW